MLNFVYSKFDRRRFRVLKLCSLRRSNSRFTQHQNEPGTKPTTFLLWGRFLCLTVSCFTIRRSWVQSPVEPLFCFMIEFNTHIWLLHMIQPQFDRILQPEIYLLQHLRLQADMVQEVKWSFHNNRHWIWIWCRDIRLWMTNIHHRSE